MTHRGVPMKKKPFHPVTELNGQSSNVFETGISQRLQIAVEFAKNCEYASRLNPYNEMLDKVVVRAFTYADAMIKYEQENPAK